MILRLSLKLKLVNQNEIIFWLRSLQENFSKDGRGRLRFVSEYRALVMMSTCIAILAAWSLGSVSWTISTMKVIDLKKRHALSFIYVILFHRWRLFLHFELDFLHLKALWKALQGGFRVALPPGRRQDRRAPRRERRRFLRGSASPWWTSAPAASSSPAASAFWAL